MRNYIYSLLTLALACVAGSAWAAGNPADYDYHTIWWGGHPDGLGYTFAPDFEANGYYYKIVDGGVELTRAPGTVSSSPELWDIPAVLPSSVEFKGRTYTIVKIGDCLFQENKWVTEITIPEGVKQIGKGAFYNAPNLTDVHLPSTLESIGEKAFAYSSLKSINLDGGIKEIGTYAFAGCKNLKYLTLGSETAQIGENAIGTIGWDLWTPAYVVAQYVWPTYLADLYCLATIPPAVDNTLSIKFKYGNYYTDPKYVKLVYETTPLHVPAESVELYRQTAPWNQFKTILGDGETGIAETVADGDGIRLEGGRIVGEGVMEVYDLGGRQVTRGISAQLPDLPAGFYIVRNSESTAKVFIR
ncbi:MAG: leucine-rich repeat domain-containing protein [Duncaniella sp.]|nr:leucine-rich repeat domain-containing protein [Duncaniella sp.]